MHVMENLGIIIFGHKNFNNGEDIILESVLQKDGEFKEFFKLNNVEQIYFLNNKENGNKFSLSAMKIPFNDTLIIKRWERIAGRNYNNYIKFIFKDGKLIESKKLTFEELTNLGIKY